jgi:hypothetical protein
MIADMRMAPRLLPGKARGEAALPSLLPADAICPARLAPLLTRFTPLKSFLSRVLTLLAILRSIAALLPLLLPGSALLLSLLSGVRRSMPLLSSTPLLTLRLRSFAPVLPGGVGPVATCVGARNPCGVLAMLPRLSCGGATGMRRSRTNGVPVSRGRVRPGRVACA